MIIGDSATCTI